MSIILPPNTERGWCPQEGAQVDFLRCPIYEVLLEGNRGGGKTDCLLHDFTQHVGPDQRTREQKRNPEQFPKWQGFGAEWRGILFRRHYKDLEDVRLKSMKWFKLRFGDRAKFNKNDDTWEFAWGERLYFRHIDDLDDYYLYHGHAYPWIAFEELTSWPNGNLYARMRSCSRSTEPGIPMKYRATTNSFGPGFLWVKRRFQLPGSRDQVITGTVDENNIPEKPRIAINLSLDENKILLKENPDYVSSIAASANGDKMLLAAWLDGSWNLNAGGLIDDVWVPKLHVVAPFTVPQSWYIDRSYDHGQSSPFAVLWWAQSDGTDLTFRNGRKMATVPGDLFLINQWYGAQGDDFTGLRLTADQIAKGIIERELAWQIHDRVNPGPADNQIWNPTGVAGQNAESVADAMAQPVRVGNKMYNGVQWTRADKSPGSRVQGWTLLRQRLFVTIDAKVRGIPREKPGLFVCSQNINWQRVVPALPRDMEKNPDDVPEGVEDHDGDATRYRIFNPPRIAKFSLMSGNF